MILDMLIFQDIKDFKTLSLSSIKQHHPEKHGAIPKASTGESAIFVSPEMAARGPGDGWSVKISAWNDDGRSICTRYF